MSVTRNEVPPSGQRSHTIRWDDADMARLEEAARALTDREHFAVTITDIIRRGARREADAILTEAAA